MKKVSFLAAALAMTTLAANAGNRILFTENYESATGYQDTKWTSNANAAGLSIVSDDFGKYLQISAGANNQRSYNCNWTKAIYEGVDNTEYDIKFDYCINAFGNNQYNSQLAVIAEDAVKAENGWTSSANKLFFIEEGSYKEENTTYRYFYINGNTDDRWSPTEGTWYTFYLHINKDTRTVSYYAMDAAGSVAIPDGEYVLPETVTDMDASTLWYAHARYQNVVWFDNITVYKDLGEGVDWANAPVVALTGLFNEERTFTIQFMEGEVLHLNTTEGTEQVVDYYDCETPGSYIYTTTTSGTIKAYTQVNDAVSEEVVIDVQCGIYQLPEAAATIVAVNPGFSKTWQITIDKSTVPLQPNVVYDYEFNGVDGSVLTGSEMASGTTISIPAEGVLKVTTKAYGYGSTTTEIRNNQAYKIDKFVDFQHITADQLSALNFTAKEPLVAATGGGESTWTSGGRLYYDWTNGTDTTRVYPFGHPVDGAFEGEGIVRMQFLQSGLTEEVASNMFAPLKVWYRGDGKTCSINEDGTDMEDANGHKGGSVNVEVKVGIGLICPGVQGDAQDYDPAGVGYGNIRVANAPISIQGYDDNAFVVVYKVQGYGNNANHGVIDAASEAEANAIWHEQGIGTYSEVYKGTDTFELYRIDTAISRVNILVPDGGAGIEEVDADSEKAAVKAPIFNLRGEKVQNMNTPGFYLQGGKVIVVK